MRLRSIICRDSLLRLLALVLVLSLTGCALTSKAGTRAQSASEGLDHYDYQLVFSPDDSTLSITMELQTVNRTGAPLQSLVLRTWAGAFASEDTSPATIDELYDACYPDGFSAGDLQIEAVWWNDTPVNASFTDEAKTVLQVDIPAFSANAAGTLKLRCTLTVPHCAHRYGYSRGVWQFGNALPMLSVFENGAWRADAYHPIGDPFISECANFDVTLTVPAGYDCAASGVITGKKTANGQTTFRMEGTAMRDFAFALSDAWTSVAIKAQGVQVTAYAADEAAARRAARNAAKALNIYSGLYGEYAYKTLTLCAVDFPFGGMEYPGLILLSSAYFYEDWADTLELTIAHEVAHQWFYAMVGSDQFYQPWQDEALSEYAMLRYVQKVYGQSAFENLRIARVDAPMQERIAAHVTPGSPIDHFGRLTDYASVVYGRGAALLLAIDAFTGKTDAFLRSYCDTFAFKIASREDFEHHLAAFTQEDLSPFIIDYLDTLI